MIKLTTLLWTSIILSTLNDSVAAICIITKDVTKSNTGEQYTDCSRGYCRKLDRYIEIGPVEYLCTNTSISEINNYSQLKKTFENQMFIKDSNISILSPNMYYWTNLTQLHIENTNTFEIVPGFFNKFDNLEVLEIKNNKLKSIVDGVFSSLTMLTSLNLSSNSITGLTSHSFSGLLRLRILDISKNKITSISPQVFDYQNGLVFVDLSQNMIEDVKDIFNNKTSLQTIQLSQNKITDFNFKQLTYNLELEKVDLSKNKIKSIKKVINVLQLNLSYNYLEHIKDNTFDSYINVIDLSNNNITVISDKSFENTTELKHLFLGHNNITTISRECLGNLKNLEILNLSYNNLHAITFGFFNNLNKLEVLDLSGNNMILDFHTLITLKSLKVLKIQNNIIINFDANLLVTRFKHLNFVSLGDNLWNCSELAETIHLLQIHNVNILPGKNTKTDNILGISCKNNVDFKEESVVFDINNQTIPKDYNKNLQFSGNRTNEENIQNNIFLKYLENIGKQFLKQNANNISNNIEQNKFIQYLNENFTNSNFYKYVESLKEFNNKTSNTFSQMMNFFDEGFNKTNFYKYLNSLKFYPTNNASNKVIVPVVTSTMNETVPLLSAIKTTISENFQKILRYLTSINNTFASNLQSKNTINSTSLGNKFEFQALRDVHLKDDKSFRNNLIFTNILLVFLVCSIMAHLYYIHFWKPKHANVNTQEQVQLM